MFDAHLKMEYQQFTQGAAQDNLSQKKLLSIKFPVPDIAHQQRISHILSAYDKLIENNHRRIKLLEKSAQLLYEEWFIHLRFPGNKHINLVHGIPSKWNFQRIDSFGKVITGKTPSTKQPEYYNGNIPFIKTPDMHGNLFVIKNRPNPYKGWSNNTAQKIYS